MCPCLRTPLAILTHRHPTPWMVVVVQGCVAGGWRGGRLSDDGASRVVGDDLVTAVMQREMGGRRW